MAAKGLRTIGVAYRDFNGNQDWESAVDGVGLEDNLTMVALLAIEDPIRVEVPGTSSSFLQTTSFSLVSRPAAVLGMIRPASPFSEPETFFFGPHPTLRSTF